MFISNDNLQELKKKGYTVIKNLLTVEDVNAWKTLIKEIEKEVVLETTGIKKSNPNEFIEPNVVLEGKKPFMFKCNGKIQTRPEGVELIKYFENKFREINDDVRFIKDRIITQKQDYPAFLPHQDNPSSVHEEITNEFYSAYVSLTDTTEQGGCLWVEDIEPKRTTSLEYCRDGCASGNTCKCFPMKITATDIKTYRGHNMVPIELKTGDCIMFDGWLLHGTATNTSGVVRQTLIFGYGAVRQEDKDTTNVYKKYMIKRKISQK